MLHFAKLCCIAHCAKLHIVLHCRAQNQTKPASNKHATHLRACRHCEGFLWPTLPRPPLLAPQPPTPRGPSIIRPLSTAQVIAPYASSVPLCPVRIPPYHDGQHIYIHIFLYQYVPHLASRLVGHARRRKATLRPDGGAHERGAGSRRRRGQYQRVG